MSLAEGRAVIPTTLFNEIVKCCEQVDDSHKMIHTLNDTIQDTETFYRSQSTIMRVKIFVDKMILTLHTTYKNVLWNMKSLPRSLVDNMRKIMMNYTADIPDLMTEISKVNTSYVVFRDKIGELIKQIDEFAVGWKEICHIAKQHAEPENKGPHENVPAGGSRKRSGIRKRKRTHRKRAHRKRTHRK